MEIKIQYDDRVDNVIDAVNSALANHGLSFKDDGKEHCGYVVYELVEENKPALVGHHLSNSRVTSLARFDHELEPSEASTMIGQPHPFFKDKLCVKVQPVGGDEWTYKLYFE